MMQVDCIDPPLIVCIFLREDVKMSAWLDPENENKNKPEQYQ